MKLSSAQCQWQTSMYLQSHLGGGGRFACEALDLIYSIEGDFASQLVWRKPMSAFRQNVSSPAGLFIHLHISHKATVSLPAISLALTPSPTPHPQASGIQEQHRQARLLFFFWDTWFQDLLYNSLYLREVSLRENLMTFTLWSCPVQPQYDLPG